MSRLVALTGATGFIGNAIQEAFLKANWQVRSLCRQPQNEIPGIEWVKGDLNTPSALQRLVGQADIVIHCAGRVRGRSEIEFLETNARGTQAMLDACHESDFKGRFLLISSLAAREPGLSWYASSKALAEKYVNARGGQFSCAVIRPTAVYGPGDQEIKPVLQLLSRGLLLKPAVSSRFSLLHVYDLVTALLLWSQHETAIVGTFELDDGHTNGYTWNDVVEQANNAWGVNVRQFQIPISALKIFANMNLFLSRWLPYSPMLTPGKVREITHSDWTVQDRQLCEKLNWSPKITLAMALADNELT